MMKLYDIAYEPIEIVRKAAWPIPVLVVAAVVIVAGVLILVLRKRKKKAEKPSDHERKNEE